MWLQMTRAIQTVVERGGILYIVTSTVLPSSRTEAITVALFSPLLQKKAPMLLLLFEFLLCTYVELLLFFRWIKMHHAARYLY